MNETSRRQILLGLELLRRLGATASFSARGLSSNFQSVFSDARIQKARTSPAVDYLESIGYFTRTTRPAPQRSGYTESYGTTTKRQEQHAWYGPHSELNWQDRERAAIFGLDADTYVSNVLENDKD